MSKRFLGVLVFSSVGQVANVYATNSLVAVRNVGQYSAIYAQDEFKVNRDLNFSLGLRYNVDLTLREGRNIGSQFNPDAINPATGTKGSLVFSGNGPGRSGLSSPWNNLYYKGIEPRIGLTWSPSYLNHQTVFSATYNILNAPILERQQIYPGIPAGYSLTGQFNNLSNPFGAAALLHPSSTVSPGIVNPGKYGGSVVSTKVNFDPAQLNGQSIPWSQRSFGRSAFYHTGSGPLQQQIATDLVLTPGYLGSLGTPLGSSLLFVNNINPSNFSLGAMLNDQAINLPQSNFSGTVAQSLRSYPQYAYINTGHTTKTKAKLSYNAMTGKLERRFHNGLTCWRPIHGRRFLPILATLSQEALAAPMWRTSRIPLT